MYAVQASKRVLCEENIEFKRSVFSVLSSEFFTETSGLLLIDEVDIPSLCQGLNITKNTRKYREISVHR